MLMSESTASWSLPSAGPKDALMKDIVVRWLGEAMLPFMWMAIRTPYTRRCVQHQAVEVGSVNCRDVIGWDNTHASEPTYIQICDTMPASEQAFQLFLLDAGTGVSAVVDHSLGIQRYHYFFSLWRLFLSWYNRINGPNKSHRKSTQLGWRLYIMSSYAPVFAFWLWRSAPGWRRGGLK